MSFLSIRDQNVPVRLMRNLLGRGRIPNGMLLWGPEGVGKGLAAREMAKAVNCHAAGDDPCDVCLSCRKVLSGNHPDVAVIAPTKKSRIIDVEAIDYVNEMASLHPMEGRWRVFLLLDADRMGQVAQNHFLKTLEEPPGNSLFLLVTEHPGLLLPTIRSRCQRLRFGALNPATIKELLLARRDLPDALAESYAALAQGQMTRALGLVDSDRREVVLDAAMRLAAGEDPLAVAEGFAGYLAARKEAVAAEIKAEFDVLQTGEASREDREALKKDRLAAADARFRRDILDCLYLFETWYRDVLVYAATGDSAHVLNKDHVDRLPRTAGADPGAKLAAIDKARLYLERFLNEERVFRDLFFALAA